MSNEKWCIYLEQFNEKKIKAADWLKMSDIKKNKREGEECKI